MIPQRRRLACLCLMSGLALAAAGQFYFAERREYLWDGVFLYAVASAFFLAAVRLVEPQPVEGWAKPWWRQCIAWARFHPWRTSLGLAGPLASLAVGARAAQPLSAGEGYGLLGLWAAGLAMFLAASVDVPAAGAWLRALPARLRARRWELALVALLFAVAALARLVRLDSIPQTLGGDEASMGREALDVLRGRLANPFATGWFSHPTLYFYILAASLRWPGGAILGLRFVPALAGALTVPALYFLARELFGRRVAFLAAAFLACYPYAIHFSRLALNNAMDPLVAVLAFALLLRGLRTEHCRSACFALAGVLFGLGLYFYTGGRAIPVILCAWLLVLVWRERGFWRANRGQLAVLAGGFLATAWPLLLFFARHPQDLLARTSQLGIIQSGWLAATAQALQRSELSLLWEQFVKSALAFHYYPDPGVFYAPGVPLLDALGAIPFTFGLVYCLAHLRERRHALLALWFGAILLFGGVLMENPPSAQRLLLTAVPASIFVALGLSLAVRVVERVAGWQPVTGYVLLGLAIAVLGVVGLQFYFGPYTASQVYPGLNTQVGHQMGLYLTQLGPTYRYYFLGAPRMFAGFPNVRYLAPDVEGEDVGKPLVAPPSVAAGNKKPVFLFLPERLGELRFVEAAYPSGRRTDFVQPSGVLLFTSYEPD